MRIIDYKSSVKNIDLNNVTFGLQLQLLTYLDAITKKENMDPAGVLYFSILEPIIERNQKELQDERLNFRRCKGCKDDG